MCHRRDKSQLAACVIYWSNMKPFNHSPAGSRVTKMTGLVSWKKWVEFIYRSHVASRAIRGSQPACYRCDAKQQQCKYHYSHARCISRGGQSSCRPDCCHEPCLRLDVPTFILKSILIWMSNPEVCVHKAERLKGVKAMHKAFLATNCDRL